MSDSFQPSSAPRQGPPAPATRRARLLARFEPTALRISFGFFLFSSLWIMFSDELLTKLVRDPDLIGELSALKGVAFVAISSLLLYGILNRYFIVLKQENLDRRKTEEQLRTSHSLQKAILDGTANAVFAKDLEGRFLLFNHGAERYTGRKAADVIGRDTRALFPEPNATEVMSVDRAIIASGQTKSYEETLLNGAGEARTFLTTKGPLRDAIGRVIGLFGVSYDITERKCIEKLTQESEERYRALFEHMHEGFAYCRMVYDERQQPVDFVYLGVNRSFGRLTGLENVEGRSVTELIPGIREMSPEVFEIYGRVAATGNSETFELYFKPIKRWLNVSAYCPAPGFFAAVFDDITERKLAADELRQSREEFRDLFEHAPVGYHEIDPEGRLVRVNQALLTMLGYTAGELLGQHVWKISAEEEVSRTAALAKLGGKASPLSFQRWFRRKDGSAFPVLIDDRVVRDAAGQITGLRAIIQDNTERHQAEVALERERTLLRTLIDTIPDPIYVKSTDSRFLLANHALARFMSVANSAELIGRSDVDFFAADLAAGFRADEEQVLAGKALISQEETIPVKGEGLRQVLTTKVPFRDPQGQIVGLVGIGRDVTGQMQAELDLKESEARLQLATNVARIGIFECDHDHDRILTSELLREIDGLGDSHSIFERFALLVERTHPADREYVGSRWAELANPSWDGTMNVVFRLQMADQSYRWLRVRLQTWFEGEGAARRPVRTIGTTMDITDQKEAAGRLEQERTLLRTLIDLLPDYIYIKDTEGRFLICNETCARFMGAPGAEALIGRTDADFYPAALAAEFQRDDAAVCAGRRLIGKEEEFTRPDGCYQVIQTTKVPLTDATGNIVGLVGAGRDITAFKLAELALQKSEARLQLATEVGRIGIFEHNHLTNEFHPSPLLVELEGMGAAQPDRFELLREHMHPEDWEGFLAKVKLAKNPAGTGRLDNEHRIRNAAGEYRWMRVQTQTWFEGEGETRHAQRTIGTVMDITERKQAEERLLVSELQFRALVEQSLVGVYRIQNGRFTYVNPRLAEILGYSVAEMLALPGVASSVMPKDRERVEENMARRNRGEIDSLHYHFTGLRADGGGVELEAYGSRSVINGQPAIIGTILDITARRQAESQLLIQTTALNAAANGIVIANVEGRILWVNQAFTRITGYAAEEAIGGKPSLLKSGQQSDDFYREMWTTILRGEVWRGELCNRRKDGGIYSEEMTITPVPGPDGEISHFIAIKQDITARKRSELALRESEELFREMAETIDEVFWVFDPASQRTIYASPAFEKIWGRTIAELYATSLSWAEPIHPEDRERVLAAFLAGIVRGSYEEQYRVVRSDGSVCWVRDRGFPVRNERGAVTRMVGIAEDVTERHRIEEQFRQAQKLEAIGTLAGGIAHDFNNILAAIIGFTELARMRVKDNPVVSEYLASVMQGSERAVALVRQILTFSRGQEQAKRPLQLRQIVSESLRLMRATIPASISFEVDLPGNLPSVLADPTQVQQVVMNLCTNASHAMKNRSGRLGVKLENVAVDNLTAAGHSGLRPGPYVRLTISDTGHGMTDATKKRIFEPFFTTKGPGEGTGLGLSVVHGIMQSYGGVITVYSEPEIGTTFHLYFLAHATATGDSAASGPEIPKGHGERILLVDDEKPIVQMSEQVLKDLGYRAECRTSAVAALEAVRANPAAYDLVITDLTMPEMTGVDLARQLLALRPDLRIILSTGFSATLTPERARTMGIRDLLLKPHTVQSLAVAVQRALSGPNP